MRANNFYNTLVKTASSYLNDPDRLSALLKRATRKTDIVGQSVKEINDIKHKILLFSRMVRAWFKKEYTNVPWQTLVSVTAGILYFVIPTDLIPDFIPITGFADDISIIIWIFKSFENDITAFENWEKGIGPDLMNTNA